MFRKIISKRSRHLQQRRMPKPSASLRSFVNCRYVLDLHKFSEWPNVKDYRVDQRLVAKTQIRFARRQEKLSRPIKIRLSRKNRTYRILEISGGPFYDLDYNDLDSSSSEEEEEEEEEDEEQDETLKTTSKRKRLETHPKPHPKPYPNFKRTFCKTEETATTK